MEDQLEIKLERIVPGSIIWDPRPDISPIELALALKVLLILGLQEGPYPHHVAASILNNMPETVKRHFIYKVGP